MSAVTIPDCRSHWLFPKRHALFSTIAVFRTVAGRTVVRWTRSDLVNRLDLHFIIPSPPLLITPTHCSYLPLSMLSLFTTRRNAELIMVVERVLRGEINAMSRSNGMLHTYRPSSLRHQMYLHWRKKTFRCTTTVYTMRVALIILLLNATRTRRVLFSAYVWCIYPYILLST